MALRRWAAAHRRCGRLGRLQSLQRRRRRRPPAATWLVDSCPARATAPARLPPPRLWRPLPPRAAAPPPQRRPNHRVLALTPDRREEEQPMTTVDATVT